MRKAPSFIHSCLLISIVSILTSSTPTTLPFTSSEGLNFYGTSNFGYSVARAGDINGDGIDDVIIGSPNESSNAGIAYVVYGSKTGQTDLTSIALTTLSANGRGFQILGAASSRFGSSVSSAGDVNGDGIDDIIIGAPYTGYAYVMFGKKTGLRDLNLLADSSNGFIGFQITGVWGSTFGVSVSGTGDINGDGIDDIIIGASTFNNYIGAAYVFYGKKTGLISMTLTASTDLVSSNTGFTILGSTSSELGISVSGAGDVNGDGINDTVIGGYYYGYGYGLAVVLFGSKTLLSDLTITPGTSLSDRGYIIASSAVIYLGSSVSSAGDINGDGLADIIIGGSHANLVSPSIIQGGVVFVIYGSKTWSSEIDIDSTLTISPSLGFRITSGVTYSYLGAFTSNIGDFNGDGVDDIILGAAGYTSLSVNGAVYVIYGNKAGLGNIDRITPTNFVDPNKGFVISPIYTVYSVSWGGDFNGDGGPDILIGAQNNSTTLGAAYILFGSLPQSAPSVSTTTSSLSPSEVAALDSLTQSLATAGKATGAAATSISIINFSNPFAAILKSISDTIYFIKYLNINYPPKLQYILDNYQSEDLVTIDNLSSAPQGLVDDMTKHPLPSKFEKYDDVDGFHSSFLVNFWSSLATLCIILIIVIITCIFNPCSNSYGGSGRGKLKGFIKWICASLSQTVKWNLMLSKFTGYYGNISLFTSIEIRTTRLSSFLEVLSLCICIIVTLGLLLVQIMMILVVHKLQKAKILAKQKNNIKVLEVTRKQLKDYEIVFGRFKDDTFFQQSFLFFYNLRIYIFYAVISWLDGALVQTLLNTLMEVIMMLYLLLSRPLKSKIELAQYIVIELIFLVVNICTLGLAVLDFYESDNQQSRIGLGDAILFCNSALTYCALAFLFLSVLLMLPDVFKMIKQKWSKVKRIKKVERRSTVKYHHNDNDASTMELDPNNISQFMNASHNSQSKMAPTERKISVLNPEPIVQYHSNISAASRFIPSENFRIKQHKALRLQRVDLNGLRSDSQPIKTNSPGIEF